MKTFCKATLIICALVLLLESCNSSRYASRKRRRMAPCDCPTFNHIPQGNPSGIYVVQTVRQADANDA